MSNQNRYSIFRRLANTAAASSLFGLGTLLPAVQAAEVISLSGTEPLLILAATDGMDRRQDRREDRRDNRGDRHDTRQDCRDEEGVVGKDKRECKQDKRQGRREDNND